MDLLKDPEGRLFLEFQLQSFFDQIEIKFPPIPKISIDFYLT
jgi:hypothetical protein